MKNAIETLALAKVVGEKDSSAARSQIGPGTYKVDFVARVTGEMRVGEDYSQRIVAKFPVWKALAFLMSKVNGVTLDASTLALIEATPDEIANAIKRAAEGAIGTLKEATLTTCAGKVTHTLRVETIGAVVAEPVKVAANV